MEKELQDFIDDWDVDENGIKPLFVGLYACLRKMDGVTLEYRGRPGISHSVRARHKTQNERPLFVLVDVIDDDPDARWLSICFYEDLTSDPDGLGDVVPGGLMGDDALCFDVSSDDGAIGKYLQQRLKEACKKAKGV